MKVPKTIGNRINIIEATDKELKVVIFAQMEKWKETLLMAWLLAWTFCGVYFVYELITGDYNADYRLFFIILLSFWLYYEVKITKAYLWRKFGKELIRISEDRLFIKNDIRSYGKMNEYFKENIKQFGLINLSEKSFKKASENSYWVVGGDTIGFEYMGKKIVFAKQLDDHDSKQLIKVIQRYL
jgi:hypothetical protein